MDTADRSDFGPNQWLIDEMHERFRDDPSSVAESWREFFEGFTSTPEKAERPPQPADAIPLRGGAAILAERMQESLSVPTATSVRTVPARLLEVNRSIVNRHIARKYGRGKVSFTHLIGWAVVRAVARMPGMNVTFETGDGSGGEPAAVHHEHVNLGLAVDVKRQDGSRTLLVPNIKGAEALDFSGFFRAYEQLITKVGSGKLTPEDFAGTTVTITNPGMIGTVQSVPRLMAGQAAIIGVGSIGYPAEYQGADPEALADVGVGKVVTLTSTYDHRVIQGAESGEFLGLVHRLLVGEEGFYEDLFQSLQVPYVPVRWERDANPPRDSLEGIEKHARVIQLINMYRVRGHLIADLDPLQDERPSLHPELDLSTYGLTVWDLEREFVTGDLGGRATMPLGETLALLRDAYCRTVGIEYMHMQEPDQKEWIQQRVEGVDTTLPKEEHLHILEKLNEAEAFETFLHRKYVGHKRFSLEGAESLIPLLDAVLDRAADQGMNEVAVGMAHRGRLNVLANTVGKSIGQIFREFEGSIDPESVQGSGDVKYHLGASGKHTSRAGKEVVVTVASNPSHLEAVDPVLEGLVRAKQDREDRGGESVLPLLIHGDAAFAGQGVVAETLNLSQLRGYRTGGTVHVIVNNQLGFTTGSDYGRSSPYASDVAKTVQAPIFHVNGDDPEACVRVARMAFEFRSEFNKDVVIDMWCYRRWGHNEGDDPSFTQPLMYQAIEKRRSVRKLYMESLVNRGDITLEEAERALERFRQRLQQAFDESRDAGKQRPARVERTPPEPAPVRPPLETAVDAGTLEEVLDAITTIPQGFEVHPKLRKWLDDRKAALSRDAVDWSLGEALAFGSLLLDGVMIRLTGQDTRRGTFSQRHSVLVDRGTGAEHVPLQQLGEFHVYDSLLSEYAAMGFEYGYSVANPDALVLWEAQFGDFVNGGQIVVDQFVVAAEDKWSQTSGLVLLLPHGYEGQGPEHSSARLERFLELSAEDNIQVAVPSTPAQYFHLLRRQGLRDLRKPLVVITPKSLLRLPAARSPAADLTAGTFHEVIPDAAWTSSEKKASRLVFCQGKVYYDLLKRREETEGSRVALVRLEQLYPFPADQVREQLERFEGAEPWWVQEEPENMGALRYVDRVFRDRLGVDVPYVAREESASPATGSLTLHQQEQEELLEEALGLS